MKPDEWVQQLLVEPINALAMLRPGRSITGMSAVLLPFAPDGGVDWEGLEGLLTRTLDAGLTPAVNMDTGYGNLIDEPTKRSVLGCTREAAKGRRFVAGAFVADTPGDGFDLGGYRRAIDPILEAGGVPVVVQSYGLTSLPQAEVIDAYAKIGDYAGDFIAFELGEMFAEFGAIYDLATYVELMKIPRCIGAKHSSLSREPEWRRLIARDRVRPDFLVLTGNDLAIDMVMYGSDYLLGLSAFAPELFAGRDRMWREGDAGFYELNDALQYLGHFAFRDPVPAYKHSAAMFLKLRQRIGCDATHPRSPTRPDSDGEVLRGIARQLERWG